MKGGNMKQQEEKKKPTLWERLWKKRKLDKGNRIAVLYLKENGTAIPKEVITKDGMFVIDGKTYHEDRDCVYTMGKERYPLAIVPEFNTTPIGTKAWEDKEMQVRFSILQDHVMKGIRHAERVRFGGDSDSKLNAKAIIAIGIVVIIILAIVLGYK